MMKNPLMLFCVATAFLAAAGAVQATTISFAVSSTTIAAGDSGQLTVTLSNTGSDAVDISAFSFGLLANSSNVVFTTADIGVTGYIFAGDSFTYIEFSSTDIATLLAAETLVGADTTDSGGSVTIAPDGTVVLAVVSFSTSSAAPSSVVTVSFLPYSYTSLADAAGTGITVDSTTSGTITIGGSTPVPEPSTFSLALLAAAALSRLHRRPC